MSFQEEYKNQIQEIKPDGYLKNKIRFKLATKPQKPQKSHTVFLRNAVAYALCAAVIFSGGFWLGKRQKTAVSPQNNGITATGYPEIYDAVKTFLPSFWDQVRPRNFRYANDEEKLEYGFAEETTGAAANGANGIETDNEGDAFSATTAQVEGVDEADVVKTDGKILYHLFQDSKDMCFVRMVDIRGAEPRVLKGIALSFNESRFFEEMYLYKDRLILLGSDYSETEGNQSVLVFYDVSDPENPKEITQNQQCGFYSESRLIDGNLYLISNRHLAVNAVRKSDPRTYIPWVRCGDEESLVPADSICLYENCMEPVYTVVCAYHAQSGALLDTKSVLGGSNTVYCNTENLITAGYERDGKTQLVRLSLDEGKITVRASGEIKGSLLNQFSIDEYKGYFRFVTTVYDSTKGDTVNSLAVLNGNLQQVGGIENIAPGERVYSVRFMGDIGYFVTFRQVDPLFSVDIHDPKAPTIIGSLKIPGFSDYLFPYGEGRLLGIGQNAEESTGKVENIKLSLFDILDPSQVTERLKTNIDASYSEALYNHKACLVDARKNLIGFAASGIVPCYFLYTLSDEGFTEIAKVPLEKDWNCRGLYAGGTFYIITPDTLLYFNLNNPGDLAEVRF